MDRRAMEKAIWAHLSGHLNGTSDEELAQAIGLNPEEMTTVEWRRFDEAAESVAEKVARH